MKKTFKAMSVIALTLAGFVNVPSASASNWDLKDALGDTGLGGTVANMVEGIFTKSDLEIKDLAGEWTADGSAVCFKADNFLKKAGGVAAAAALETKLNPYFEKYGLVGAVFSVAEDGTFTIKVKKMLLKGDITKNDDGTFTFNFKAFDKIKLGKMTAYVQKSYNNLDVMFDATKLKQLVSTVAGVTGIGAAKTLGNILDGYDGLCVGCSMAKTGEAPAGKSDSKASGTSKSPEEKEDKAAGDSVKSKPSAGDVLRAVLGGNKK